MTITDGSAKLRVVVRASTLTGLLLSSTAASAEAQAQGGWRTDFSKHTVPLTEIVSGGPPKDGIPPIDQPKFESVRAASSWLNGREPVVVVEAGGAARAYPLQILMWHEIVNDVIAGVPVSITYCPLCNTAITFSRRLDGDTTSFGTTGRLRLSDLVMYDRRTETWWQQATGEGLVGQHAGGKLTRYPSTLVSYSEFRKQFPEGQVLSRNTGFPRDYGRTPYARYDAENQSPIAGFFGRRPDPRLKPMERVGVVSSDDDRVIVPFSRLEKEKIVTARLGQRPVVIWWIPGTASSMDAPTISEGKDVGAVAAFSPVVDGRTLTFKPADLTTFQDQETGTIWSFLGHGLTGPLAGKRLDQIDHGAYFWFAVAAFYENARLLTGR